MKINRATLNTELTNVAKEWDISGSIMVLKEGEVLHDAFYGYADRENGLLTQKDSRYLIHSESGFILGLCAFILADQGKLKLKDKLSMYIPEYKHAGLMTVEQLLRSNTGIPDFFYSNLMIGLNKDEQHMALSDFERMRVEKKCFYEAQNFDSVMALIGEEPLEYTPGTSGLNMSETNWVFLAEVVRRVSGMSVFEFQKQNIFEPLQMDCVREGAEADTVSYTVYKEDQLVRMPLDYPVNGLFSVTSADMLKFLAALAAGQLLSKKMWQAVLKYDEDGEGLAIENANGYDCGGLTFIGSGFYFYFSHKTGIAFASLVNEEQTCKSVDNQWHYFRRSMREVIEATFTYPTEPRLVKVSTENLWAALNIKVAEDQQAYVLEAKSSIAMGLLYKTKKPYVLVEGTRVIGILVLDLDKKKNHYNIDIIQIDKRYQGRGYGKIMLEWAVAYLKEAGAKELEIGVNRYNTAAQKIYFGAGFKEKSVYEEGMRLHLQFE